MDPACGCRTVWNPVKVAMRRNPGETNSDLKEIKKEQQIYTFELTDPKSDIHQVIQKRARPLALLGTVQTSTIPWKIDLFDDNNHCFSQRIYDEFFTDTFLTPLEISCTVKPTKRLTVPRVWLKWSKVDDITRPVPFRDIFAAIRHAFVQRTEKNMNCPPNVLRQAVVNAITRELKGRIVVRPTRYDYVDHSPLPFPMIGSALTEPGTCLRAADLFVVLGCQLRLDVACAALIICSDRRLGLEQDANEWTVNSGFLIATQKPLDRLEIFVDVEHLKLKRTVTTRIFDSARVYDRLSPEEIISVVVTPPAKVVDETDL